MTNSYFYVTFSCQTTLHTFPHQHQQQSQHAHALLRNEEGSAENNFLHPHVHHLKTSLRPQPGLSLSQALSIVSCLIWFDDWGGGKTIGHERLIWMMTCRFKKNSYLNFNSKPFFWNFDFSFLNCYILFWRPQLLALVWNQLFYTYFWWNVLIKWWKCCKWLNDDLIFKF